jgi:glycosyltransferase involved in cell wall biosynthesis
VIEVGRCTDPELTAHLKNARALLFPSLVEGYGLPLIEALHAGVPVIASDLPVFREIGQNIPDFLDPVDPAAWERQILSYASDESASRAAQLERLEGYRAPSWADHFAGVNAWLETL